MSEILAYIVAFCIFALPFLVLYGVMIVLVILFVILIYQRSTERWREIQERRKNLELLKDMIGNYKLSNKKEK